MSNPKRGETILHVGGKPLKVRFSFNALCALEAEFKQPVTDIFGALEENVEMRAIRSILKAGLECGEGHSYAHNAVGDIIDEVGIAETGLLIAKAFEAAFGHLKKDDEGEAPEDPPQETSTGTNSDE